MFADKLTLAKNAILDIITFATKNPHLAFVTVLLRDPNSEETHARPASVTRITAAQAIGQALTADGADLIYKPLFIGEGPPPYYRFAGIRDIGFVVTFPRTIKADTMQIVYLLEDENDIIVENDPYETRVLKPYAYKEFHDVSR